MDNFDRDLDDLLNMTDSDDDSDSSNGAVFENRNPVVLELHEIKKDEPTTEAITEALEAKRKEKRERRKKRKQQQNENRDARSDTSSSLSDSVPTVVDEANKEEFYDAHESYHALSGNIENQQTSPTAALVLAQVHPEQVEDPKTIPDRTTSQRPSATPREPSTISKPVSNPPPQ